MAMGMRILMLMLLFGMVAGVSATSTQTEPVFNGKVAPADVPRLVETIRAGTEPGGRWDQVPDRDRPELEKRLHEMETLLQGHASVDELTADEKLRLLNAQEQVNAILTEHDGERLICKRETPTGSHRPQVNCKTVAQRRLESESARQALRQTQRSTLRAPGGE
jgi:hypothetical protein